MKHTRTLPVTIKSYVLGRALRARATKTLLREGGKLPGLREARQEA